MRQAGRYLPEYREVRGDGDILDTCLHPDLVAEITLQPLRRMAVDAAILFSDIMVPLAAVGVPVRIEPGVGPVVDEPIRTLADVASCGRSSPRRTFPHVLEAIRLLRKELDVPLIGFAGAPFTLASYLIEGGPSRTHERTKALMLGEPAVWDALMEALVAIVAAAPAGAGRRRGRRRSRSSTRGLGCSVLTRTCTTCSDICAGCSTASPTSASRSSTSASGRASCSR